MALTTVNSSGIKDDSIVNADIKSDAAIALSKLASTPAVLTGSTNNTITTVIGANAIQGEANLTCDGTNLTIGSGSSSVDHSLKLTADTGTFTLKHNRGSHKLELSDSDGTGDILAIDTSGRLLLGAGSISLPKGSAAGSFDLDNGNITMCIGGNSNSTGRTNSTDKVNRITSPHYTNTEEPVALLSSFNQSGNSTISYGGGSSQTNAVTQHAFYTAANTTTTNGIERMRIDSSGRLGIGTDSPTRYLHVKETAGGNAQIIVETTANAERAQIEFKSPHGTWVTGTYGGNTTGDWLTYTAGDHDAVFHQNGSEKLRIESSGDVKINDGDLVIGTAGHGIDFSAQTASSATGATTADETLDHYETGTWTPYDNSGAGLTFPTVGTARYIRVGNLVQVNFYVTYPTTSNSSTAIIGGLPFNQASGYHFMVCRVSGAGSDTAMFQLESSGAYGYILLGINFQTNANLSGNSVLASGTYYCA